MSFAIIKNEEILYFSEEKPEDLEFDEIIDLQEDYNYKNDYNFVDGKIIKNIKKEFQDIIIPEKTLSEKKLEVITKLGNLDIQKRGLELLGEDLTEINIEIDNLKLGFNNLK